MTQLELRDPDVRSPAALVHPSNLLTYIAVTVAATGALLATLFGNVHAGAAAIAIAVIADTFDGKFSRRFSRTPFQSAFGVQLDSLADAITSGFVPVMIMSAIVVGGPAWQTVLWALASATYVIAALTRLGYYNLTESTQSCFVGLPAPAASLFVSTALLFRVNTLVGAAVLVACAGLMLAPIRIPRPRGRGLVLFAIWALLLAGLHAVSSAG